MNDMDSNLDQEIRIWQERLFKRSIRRNRKFERITELIGTTSNLQYLEISAGDGVISKSFRKLGGSWKTAVSNKMAADSVGYFLNETTTLIEEGKLPFEDHTFDRVVIVDALKDIANDYDFLRECHRILKNDGWVIISASRRATFSLPSLFQHLLRTTPVSQGKQRNGYTSNELFNILKDGYDVPETICHSNGLLESVATIGEFFQKTILHGRYWMIREKAGQDDLYRYRKLHNMAGVAYPLFWICSKLEFLAGHRLLVKSRRRHWRPRTTPKLIDGRSIAEATINTKIGTAAPF